MKDKKTGTDLPSKFSIETGLLEHALSMVEQFPVRDAHKLLKRVKDNIRSDVHGSTDEMKRTIIRATDLNDVLGYLTVLPVFISMEVITTINMGLAVPGEKPEESPSEGLSIVKDETVIKKDDKDV